MKNLASHSKQQKLSTMIFGLTLLMMSVANVSFAKDVTLIWDANQEPGLAGYKVYYGTSPGIYTGTEAIEGTSPIEMGNGTSAAFVGLDDTKTHYFTVTAYNFSGEESAYANEVNAPAISNNDIDGDGYDYTVDCDDYNAAINPGAVEIYNNGIDENCNGMGDDVQTPAVAAPAGAIQAENGSLTTPMQTVADSAAANSSYVQTSTGDSGTASYNFNIANAGVYKVVARVFAADAASDSFFVTIDNAAEVIWDLNPTSAAAEFNVWREDNVTNRGAGTPTSPQYDPYTVELQSGNHNLMIRGRETNARLDYFYLVKVGEIAVTDADQDGYDVNDDCNDSNPAINPGALEITYNGIDENCNGMTDDDDLDSDGYSSANDCDDSNPAINPGALEITYNSIDENCNGMTDDDDLDQDGYASLNDCNDYNAAINPGAVEIYNNGIDENCNGMGDDVQTPAIAAPAGAIQAENGSLTTPMQTVADSAAANGSYIQTSASDSGTASYSFNLATSGVYKIVARVFAADGASDSFYVSVDNAAEVIWDLNPTSAAAEFNVWREDNVTNRGTGTPTSPQYDPYTLELQSGNHNLMIRGRETNAKLDYFYLVKVGEIAVTDADQDGYDVNDDCNDNDASINPGAVETPYNGVDENCNGMADDDDLDFDGYTSANDCDDSNPAINPGAIEISYNGIDENCNGMADDDDLDFDGYTSANDCDDSNPAINPGALEITYNGIDENCNGMADDDDLDFDGYTSANDCDDSNPAINPGASEISYNGIDENCNGMADDDDLDFDGYTSLYDCNDNDSTINPGAVEIFNNGIDENCNGMGDDVQLTTPEADTTAPTITSFTPADGTILDRHLIINVVAEDDVIVLKTEIYIDGQLELEEPGNIAELKINIRKLSDGNHSITARAYDQAANMSERAITVVK